MDFKEAIKLVELRGRLMQEAVPAGTGAMYAIIGLDNDAIARACEEAAQGQVVSPVNFNSPGQVVIAGEKDAVERAGHYVRKRGKTCTAVVGQCAVTLCINEAGC